MQRRLDRDVSAGAAYSTLERHEDKGLASSRLAPGTAILWAGYNGAQRTGRIGSGLITSGATSLCGFTIFVVYVAVATPTLLLAPIEKPFIFVITLVLLVIDLVFGIAVGLLGAVVGKYFFPPVRTRLT